MCIMGTKVEPQGVGKTCRQLQLHTIAPRQQKTVCAPSNAFAPSVPKLSIFTLTCTDSHGNKGELSIVGDILVLWPHASVCFKPNVQAMKAKCVNVQIVCVWTQAK